MLASCVYLNVDIVGFCKHIKADTWNNSFLYIVLPQTFYRLDNLKDHYGRCILHLEINHWVFTPSFKRQNAVGSINIRVVIWQWYWLSGCRTLLIPNMKKQILSVLETLSNPFDYLLEAYQSLSCNTCNLFKMQLWVIEKLAWI